MPTAHACGRPLSYYGKAFGPHSEADLSSQSSDGHHFTDAENYRNSKGSNTHYGAFDTIIWLLQRWFWHLYGIKVLLSLARRPMPSLPDGNKPAHRPALAVVHRARAAVGIAADG